MSDKRFVDTNILLYAHDASKGKKHQRAVAVLAELWRSESGVLSTQVLQEFCFNLRRKVDPPLSIPETRRRLIHYMEWPLVVNTSESVLGALELEERYQISFWDALIIQAAQISGATILYSEDLNDGQRYGPTLVVNPFLH